jgi:hypothetical protein
VPKPGPKPASKPASALKPVPKLASKSSLPSHIKRGVVNGVTVDIDLNQRKGNYYFDTISELWVHPQQKTFYDPKTKKYHRTPPEQAASLAKPPPPRPKSGAGQSNPPGVASKPKQRPAPPPPEPAKSPEELARLAEEKRQKERFLAKREAAARRKRQMEEEREAEEKMRRERLLKAKREREEQYARERAERALAAKKLAEERRQKQLAFEKQRAEQRAAARKLSCGRPGPPAQHMQSRLNATGRNGTMGAFNSHTLASRPTLPKPVNGSQASSPNGDSNMQLPPYIKRGVVNGVTVELNIQRKKGTYYYDRISGLWVFPQHKQHLCFFNPVSKQHMKKPPRRNDPTKPAPVPGPKPGQKPSHPMVPPPTGRSSTVVNGVQVSLDYSKVKGGYVYDRLSGLWMNPQQKMFFDPSKKVYMKRPGGEHYVFRNGQLQQV